MKNLYTSGLSLQLFGEQASGETGENAPLQTGVTGEAAPSQTPSSPSLEQQFEELVNGQFKEIYRNRVSGIVQKRLKGIKPDEATKEFMDALFERYKVPGGDLPALKQAVLGPDEDPLSTNALAGSVYEDLTAQADALAGLYPSFELHRELQNPAFCTLLTLPGVDMQTAFELTHKEEILPAVIAAASRAAETRIAKGLASGASRPGENGMGGESPSFTRRDVSTFTKEQMEDICRRVSRGEKIYL